MVLFDTNPVPLACRRSHYHGASSPTIDTTHGSKKALRSAFPQRRITFARVLHSVMELPLKSQEEKNELHYGRKEFRMFQQDRIQVCMYYEQQYHSGQRWEETDLVTMRGLEDFFGEYTKEQIRRIHTMKVLMEQTRQRHQGECCSDTLRFVASESSGHARVKANRVGELDELFVRQDHMMSTKK